MIGKWLRASLASLIWMMTTKLSGGANIGMRSISPVRSAGRANSCRPSLKRRRPAIEKSDIQYDVVVVGTGESALSAAIRAEKRGLSGLVPTTAIHCYGKTDVTV